MAKSQNRVQAVDIACEILNALRANGNSGVTELAKELGYAKSAVHTQLATLVANEFVTKNGSSYRLSLQFLDIAESVKSQIGKYDAIVSEVNALAEKTGETAQFAVEEHDWAVYLYKCEGESGVATASSVGKQVHLHSTAIGKAILSRYSEERVKEIITRRGLPAQTENTISTEEELMGELEKTREQGFALDDEEQIPGLRCVSMPVVDENGNPIGALSLSGPSQRMTDERINSELKTKISESSNVIQLNNKYM
jgi:DNA-binding IclR family transcriptional regulator